MTKGRNSVATVFIGISLFMFIILLIGCGSSSNKATPPPTLYWYEWPDGSIHTRDAERLQKLIPFNIVFPKYMPHDFNSYPPLLIKSTGIRAEVKVRLDYDTPTSLGHIEIEEDNWVVDWQPNKKDEYIYLDISGMRVLEEKGSNSFSSPEGPQEEPNLNYMWNQGNITFHITVTGYDQTEGRKIVESMINQ